MDNPWHTGDVLQTCFPTLGVGLWAGVGAGGPVPLRRDTGVKWDMFHMVVNVRETTRSNHPGIKVCTHGPACCLLLPICCSLPAPYLLLPACLPNCPVLCAALCAVQEAIDGLMDVFFVTHPDDRLAELASPRRLIPPPAQLLERVKAWAKHWMHAGWDEVTGQHIFTLDTYRVIKIIMRGIIEWKLSGRLARPRGRWSRCSDARGHKSGGTKLHVESCHHVETRPCS